MNRMPNNTFVDDYIKDGRKALMGLHRFYDTILMYDSKSPDRVCRIPIDDLFLKYREHLAEAATLYQVPQSQFYRPKSVSLELYGTTELWAGILRLNEMRNISEFNRQIIKVYEPRTVKELIQILFKRERKIT